MLASIRKSLADIPLRVKIHQEQVHSTYQSQKHTNLPIPRQSSNIHAVLQPIRADFQRQVVECGKVNDKDSREGTT